MKKEFYSTQENDEEKSQEKSNSLSQTKVKKTIESRKIQKDKRKAKA